MLLVRPQTIGPATLTASNIAESDPLWGAVAVYNANDRVRVLPGSLDLNFATGSYTSNGASYALTAIPGYSYTRAGTGSYYNATNAVDTIDDFLTNVQPVVSNAVGYKAYGAATNLELQSSVFGTAPWTTYQSSITANAATAPDGTVTADKLIAAAVNDLHSVNQGEPKAAESIRYTTSRFFKAAELTFAAILVHDGNNGNSQFFNLAIGAVASNVVIGTGFTGVQASIVSFGNGWYRCIVRYTSTSIAGLNTCIEISADGNRISTGDGAGGIYAWGAQTIEGDFSDGGPILNTTSAVTSIGAPAFSVSLPNGTYTATYTFDDSTTQTVSTVITNGVFMHPDATMLNRPTVKRTQLSLTIGAEGHHLFESLSGTPHTATMTIASPCVVTWNAHGLAANTPILFMTTGALPTGITANTIYYVLAPLTNSFNISATAGGSAINTSGTQSGSHTAVANPNKGNDPTAVATAFWLDLGASNKWAMFDQKNNTPTTDPALIDVTLSLTGRVDSLALLGLTNAVTVEVIVSTIADGTVYDNTIAMTSTIGISDWYSWFSENIERRAKLFLSDLPAYSNPTVRVIITGTGTATLECGSLIVGKSKDLGSTLHDGASVGITDYSRKDVDEFGNYTIIERAFADIGTFKMRIARAQVDGVKQVLATYRATPAVYSAAADYDSTLIFGFFRSFDIEIDYPEASLVSIEIEGLT